MIPLHGHTCYYFNVFPGECKIYQDIFQDFLTKSIRFLFVSRFFPENHFTAAGMCRKGLPPPLGIPSQAMPVCLFFHRISL